MLQVIISPAKKMRIDADAWGLAPAGAPASPDAPGALPPFPRKSAALVGRLQSMGRGELKSLWKTSDRLTDESLAATAALAVQAGGEPVAPDVAARLTPAAFSYDGIQYTSLAATVMDARALAWLQAHLWIVSGLYGCVRPFTGVMPYRLEMGALLRMPGSAGQPERAESATPCRNLYEYWGADIAHAACGAGGASPQQATCVVNLASVEYAKAVLPHLPASARCVTCVFGELLRDGKPVQRATASKVARGSMVRWMAETGVEDPSDLVRFSVGYRFAPELSSTDGAGGGTLVFMRDGSRGRP